MSIITKAKSLFKWIGYIKKFSDSLKIFLEYAQMCLDDITAIWEIPKTDKPIIKKVFNEIKNELKDDKENNNDSFSGDFVSSITDINFKKEDNEQ